MNIFEILAEQRIADAVQRGEFDGLPGAGRPLDLDDDPLIPAETRMLNRILGNAGVAPPEIELRRRIAGLRREIADLPDGTLRRTRRGQLALALIELSALRGR